MPSRQTSPKRNQKQSHKNKQHSKTQCGGSGSDYVNLFHAVSPTNIHALSKYTADRINVTPMFNPLRYNTQIATPTDGIIPSGVVLGNGPVGTGYYWQGAPVWTQYGGYCGNSRWVNRVKEYANQL